ncbi:MAG: ABC transporter permease [Gammaproteobacteria bacterium]|nr:ABC transporter permease [Gammaproteobacteria bacterium]
MKPSSNITFISFSTIVSKEITRFIRIWSQTLLPPAIIMALYFIIFGNFVGSQLPLTQGYTYMQFIAPGLIMMAVITNAYNNVVSSFFTQRFQKSVDEILVSPTPNWVILLGFSTGGILRGVLVGIIVGLIALCFTHLHFQHLFVTFIAALLTSIFFSFAGFTNALFARKFDDVAIIPTFILTPLTYLGGVFYSLNQLPPHWQTFAKLNPIIYMVDTFRYGLLGITDINVYFSLGLLFLLTCLLFFVNLYLLNKGVGLKP